MSIWINRYMPSDKAALKAALKAANGKVEAAYTPDSWMSFVAAKTAAIGVRDSPYATQAQINGATADLNAKMGTLLVRANKSGLQAKIEEAKTKKQTTYTLDTWNALQTQISSADAVNRNLNATQVQTNAAVTALQSKMNALVVREYTMNITAYDLYQKKLQRNNVDIFADAAESPILVGWDNWWQYFGFFKFELSEIPDTGNILGVDVTLSAPTQRQTNFGFVGDGYDFGRAPSYLYESVLIPIDWSVFGHTTKLKNMISTYGKRVYQFCMHGLISDAVGSEVQHQYFNAPVMTIKYRMFD